MPIKDIQITLREVGRIRCGDQVQRGKGKAPRKLDRFRFTSDDAQQLAIVAELYGGSVEQWEGAADQYQVYTTAERIPVMMVPGLRPITQWMEAWSGGGCLRRCDGYTDSISGQSCLCNGQGERICKPTTRLHVVLPEIPGLGTWRLESHGYYAAVELGGTVELITRLATATGEPVYGTLRLTQRTQKIAGQPTRHFAVPTLDINVTVPDLAQKIALAEADQRPLDARNAQRLTELAQGHDTGAGAFPGAADRQAAEDRGQAKLARKRTPGMGPGNRHRGTTVPSKMPLNEATEDGPPLDDYAPADVVQAFDSPISANQMKAIQTLFRMTGLDDRDGRLLFAARIIGRSINTSKDLTSREASQLLNVLGAVEQGTAEYVTDVDGRIIGAVPVDVVSHDDPLSDAEPLPDE
jgi:hypothetical protein